MQSSKHGTTGQPVKAAVRAKAKWDPVVKVALLQRLSASE